MIPDKFVLNSFVSISAIRELFRRRDAADTTKDWANHGLGGCHNAVSNECSGLNLVCPRPDDSGKRSGIKESRDATARVKRVNDA